MTDLKRKSKLKKKDLRIIEGLKHENIFNKDIEEHLKQLILKIIKEDKEVDKILKKKAISYFKNKEINKSEIQKEKNKLLNIEKKMNDNKFIQKPIKPLPIIIKRNSPIISIGNVFLLKNITIGGNISLIPLGEKILIKRNDKEIIIEDERQQYIIYNNGKLKSINPLINKK